MRLTANTNEREVGGENLANESSSTNTRNAELGLKEGEINMVYILIKTTV